VLVGALKHFAFVGVVFTLVAGWALTLVVNGLLGAALTAGGSPPGESYAGSLLLTVSSLALIAIATYVGNRLYIRRLATGPVPRGVLVLSTLLLICTTLPMFGPQLTFAVDKIIRNLSYSYNHPGEAVKLLSLPMLRLCLLPPCYVLTARMQFAASSRHPTPDQGAG
jgi:hypothetical protein